MWSNIGGYLDATLVVCALIGLFGARCRGLRIALALWVLAAMSKTFGVATVSHLLNHLPAFHSIAFYRYSQASWELAVIVLAAFGIDDMARRSLRPVVIVGAGVVSLGVIAWAAGQAWPVMTSATGYSHPHCLHRGQRRPGRRRRRRRGDRWSALVRRRQCPGRRRIGRLLVAGAVAVEAAVLFAAPALSAPRPAPSDMALVHFLQRHLGLSRFATLGPIQPNFGSFFGLAEINVNDLPVPKEFTSTT